MAEEKIDVSNMTLSDVTQKASEKAQAYGEKAEALNSANQKVEEAKQAASEAINDIWNQNSSSTPEEKLKKIEETNKLLEEAEKEAEEAQKELEQSAEEAQKAQEELKAKKDEMEAKRPTDETYVVYTAQIKCMKNKEKDYGMRSSILVLPETHGIFVRGIPQMTVLDNLAEKNIINFGGCCSKENPSTVETAKEIAKQATEEAKKDRNLGEKLVDGFMGFISDVKKAFTGEEDDSVDESLIEICYGECTPILIPGVAWTREKEKVSLNGEAPLLRRCELHCLYGGTIILETSGQPE